MPRLSTVVAALLPARRGNPYSLLLAIVLMLLALFLRLRIAPVEAGLQYVTFFPAVTLAAVAGGYRPGLLATLIGMAFATFIFTPPYYSLSSEVLGASLWSNLVFLMDGIIVSFSIEAMHRFREKYRDEIEQVKRSEALAQALNSQLTERNDQLGRSEEALRAADRHKNDFLAMLAHELRNPLTPIRLSAQLLSQPGLDESHVQWAAATISERVDHITRMVDDLLDVSRLSHGRIELKLERIEFVELAKKAVEAMRPTVEAKRHRLSLRLPDGPMYLEADRVRLTQVLVNLLDNAAKYTPEGGHIELSARIDGTEIEIVLRDDGLGIAADLLPHIFELFRQGERTLDRSQGGLGIGLNLAARLVALHGGRIEADSPGIGRGAAFTIRLPTAPAPVVAVAPVEATPARTGMRVMVVDDDRLIAFSLAKMLELHGYSVRAVASGDAALELAPEFQPRAILLDIGLVGMDGYETARRLRALPGGAGYRLIAVTGYGDEAAQARGKAAGFDAHLTKPVDYPRLAAELARAEG